MRADGASTRSPLVAVALAVALAASAAVGGVLAFGSPGAPTPDPIGLDASEAYDDVDGLQATRTTVVERGGETHRTVAEVRLRPGTQYRHIAVEAATDRRYELVVANGSALALYDRDANAVARFGLSGPVDPRTPGDRIEALFERLNVTAPDGSASTTASVSPLPVVPRTDDGPTPTATDAGHLRISFDGTATVDGREAYVLRVSEAAGAASDFEQTLWVDAEHFFPLKQRTEWADGGESASVTTTYENVTFDPGLGDDAFAFDAPANATVETLDTPEQTTYATVDRLREATDLAVPRPDVPVSFRLAYASKTNGEVSGVGVQYVSETGSLSVAKYSRTFPARGDRTVSLGETEAAVSVGSTTSVSWNCGDYRYTVRGQGVPVDVLVSVAKSVACE
ncbi:LolA family protein [Halobacterium litoreum]|uniref:Outer membrane lipoprotein carrier protein LolA n=1 Tax=Halobacterium litoreum TaxID=2039234 RepID=A0ABD5NH60_9EURY|nr:outer membrane lipoprotein carrier protein LolA [Halobacterium litoreum]UHH12563.1 outer membrane lipoprotein carrier protein LolA [Halobacterium litoreum]